MDLPAAIPDIICKIVVIGDSNVGKTSLSRRFTENEFSTKFGETLGSSDFLTILFWIFEVAYDT